MEILAVTALSKSFGDKDLFNHIDFSIETGERIGLVGVNGTGKSTFLKVLAGVEPKDSGQVRHPKAFSLSYLAQEATLNEELSVLDEIYTGEAEVIVAMRAYEYARTALENNPLDVTIQRTFQQEQERLDRLKAWDQETQAKTILSKLGIKDYYVQIKQLSGGQKKRVALAKALIQPADLLILDEPTNHLDHQAIEWLEKFLPSYQGALILVTHDRYFLNRVTNRIYELDKGNLYRYVGNYETYLEKKQLRLMEADTQREKHANTLKKELAWLKAGVKARTTKQKARIDRVHEMKAQTFEKKQQAIELNVGAKRLGNDVLHLESVSKRFDGQLLFDPFSFLVKPKDRIGIVGPNGSGKSTLLHLITGKLEPDSGEINVGETVKFGYYTQDHSEMDENLKIIEYIRKTADVLSTSDGQTITAEQMLERFLFSRSEQWTYIHRLSGGEKRRLYLLKVLMEEPNVLLLDEPTNDLDTETLAILEEYLEQFPGVVITVSHDRYFLDKVVEQLWVFHNNKAVSTYYGNYSAFLNETKETEQSTKEQKQKPALKERKRKLSYHEQKEWATIEEDIALLEDKIEQEKEAIINAGSDSEKVRHHYDLQLSYEEALDEKMDRWETLSLIVEEMEE